MLDEETRKKIIDFVSLQPRSIEEIAKHIGKNWRTANRYVDLLSRNGFLAVKVFRKGTRGALKIVYINTLPYNFTILQSDLYDLIKTGRKKEDFSPFDIWQYIDDKKKRAFLEKERIGKELLLNKEMIRLIRNAKSEVLVFSGNLSWTRIALKEGEKKTFFKKLINRGVSINILCRVDITSSQIIEDLLSINRSKRDKPIRIRHRAHPLRGIVVDNSLACFKEVRDPLDYKPGELDKKTYILYEFFDKEWIDWIRKVFWEMFNKSIDVEERLKEIEKIKYLNP